LSPAIGNFVLNLVLVPAWGARAAAVATVSAYALFAALAFAVGRKYYRFTGLGPIAVISALAALVSLYPSR
jgi:O-antigen/teichoic acid export membrane protein